MKKHLSLPCQALAERIEKRLPRPVKSPLTAASRRSIVSALLCDGVNDDAGGFFDNYLKPFYRTDRWNGFLRRRG
jgi:hypothetical protein